MRDSYLAAGLDPPRQFIWCEGPTELRDVLADPAWKRAGRNVRREVLNKPLRSLEGEFSAVHCDCDAAQSRDMHAANRLVPVSRSVHAAVQGYLDETPRRTVKEMLAALLGFAHRLGRSDMRLAESGFSQHEASSLFVLDVMRYCVNCGRRSAGHITQLIDALRAVGLNVGWAVPCRHACLLCERHNLISIDEFGRLHSNAGPALGYPDGWSHYAWKGAAVRPWMIDSPGEIRLDRMEREPSLVMRHCMVDIFTPERFILNGYAERAAQDDCGILWRRRWGLGGEWAAVEVVNGTPEQDGSRKRYYLPVPGPLVKSPRQAVAWTYGLGEEQYRRLRVRT